MTRLTIDVWSDIACPWCYVGKRRLEAALERFEHRDEVEISWHAFELDPSAPRSIDTSVPYVTRLARKYRVSDARAEAMLDNMTRLAAEDGIEMRFDRIQPGNTFDAHRLLRLAAERGLMDELEERFFRAYLTDGEPIGDPEALVRVAADVGIDADEAQGVLSTDLYAAEVRADQAEAAAIGVTGVPFFVLARKYAVQGAQGADTMLQVLEKAWSEIAPPRVEVLAEGASCGPEGCA